MRRAAAWLRANFLVAFLFVLIVQLAALAIGVQLALSRYARVKQEELEAIARQILVNPESVEELNLQNSNPLSVFSVEGDLVFSNRGRGRAALQENLLPVRLDGALVGYFFAGEMKFVDSEANRVFLSTLLILAGSSIVASIGIGIGVSLVAARRIVDPVTQMRADILKIESRSVVSARDYTIKELGDISQSLERLSRMLAQEEEYKRQWMQDIAHDLRTPIGGLRSQIEGMRDGVLAPSTDRFERNLREVDRLQGLVDGIAELAAAEELTEIDIESFPANEFIREVSAPHELSQQKSRVVVEPTVEVDTLRANRALLLRAVGNVVANAFTYGASGGQIGISVRGTPGQREIVVSDRGPGIPPQDLERIFNRFFRGEYARHSAGTGLGLNIARTIVERHRGTLVATNSPSGGAVFTITLPA